MFCWIVGRSVRIAAVYLTPNYRPDEDGPLDLAVPTDQVMHCRDLILQRIKTA
jgi:hypothetical protein